MPREIKSKTFATLYVRMPAALHRRFVAVCNAEKRSMNAQVEVIFEEWLSLRKSVEDAPPPVGGEADVGLHLYEAELPA